MKKIITLIILVSILYLGHGIKQISAQLPKNPIGLLKPGGGSLTEGDAAAGIREALIRGTSRSVDLVSVTDGFLGNPVIKIPFPEQAKDVESRLRALGLGSMVDDVVTSMNRAAEDASKSAAEIFISAINAMTIQDALAIVKGNEDAATRYLERTTSAGLKERFTPVINESLDKVDATRLWEQTIRRYNQIPLVKKQNPDLAGYVTEQAIKGLFVMVAREEAMIRKDPVARTSDILKKVFGQ